MFTFVLLLCSIFAMAGNIAVVEGKAYTLVPKETLQCGETKSPAWFGNLVPLQASIRMGKTSAEALCKSGKQEFCSEDAKKKMGLDGLFNFIRNFPSQRTEGCKTLRQECEKLCVAEGLYSAEECLVECSQYESYNR